MINLKSGLAIVALIAAIGSTTAWAQMQHGAAGDTLAGKAYMAGHEKMTADMNAIKLTGDADKDFVMMMIPHHQGAIDMAEVELKHGKNPDLKAMAEKIIADQKKEIAEMEKWLKANK